jgi:hypothetical protein
MGKTKAKNDSLWQMGTLPFVALWAGSYAAAWTALWLSLETLDDILRFSDGGIIMFAISFITLVPALFHVQLVERLLKQRMRGWMLYTLAGTLLTFIVYTDSSLTSNRFVLTLMSLFLPAALLQAVWLRRRVQAAWLWPLATIVAGLVFSLPMRSSEEGSPLIMLVSGLLYGLVQGGIMRYLWFQPKETEKAKLEAVHSVEDHTTHLQDTDATPAPWLYSDENTQRKTRQSL